MSRPERIAHLIQGRQPLAEASDRLARALRDLFQRLEDLDRLRRELADRLPPGTVRDGLGAEPTSIGPARGDVPDRRLQ